MPSQGGNEVLIKAVALSIPIYSMSRFLLLGGLRLELKSMIVRLWWGKIGMKEKYIGSIGTKMCESKFEVA